MDALFQVKDNSLKPYFEVSNFVDLGKEVITQFIPYTFHLFNIRQKNKFERDKNKRYDMVLFVLLFLLLGIIIYFFGVAMCATLQREVNCVSILLLPLSTWLPSAMCWNLTCRCLLFCQLLMRQVFFDVFFF
jgi:hypothetical protein